MTLDWDNIFPQKPVFDVDDRFPDGRIKSGWMMLGSRRIKIVGGIPRFVENNNYAKNFGIQWNRFKQTQLDSYTKLPLTLDTFIRRIPKIVPMISALTLVPCWNYYYLPLSKKQKVEWAIMDTFDALGAYYDFPKTLEEVREMVGVEGAEDLEVFSGSNGVVANLRKRDCKNKKSRGHDF